jgi:hypothetical protein
MTSRGREHISSGEGRAMTKMPGPLQSISVVPAVGLVAAGRTLEVMVAFVPDRPVDVTDGHVELIRTTAVTHIGRNWTGAGSKVSLRSSSVISRADLGIVGPLAPGQCFQRQLELAVPPGEATIAGRLVQQDYVARFRVRAGRDAGADAVVRVVSVTPVRAGAADAAPVTDDAGFAVLAIEAPAARQLTAGVPLIGAVTVAPLDAGTARGVRLELVLDEHVPARPREPLEEDCNATTVVAAVSLAENVGLLPGTMLRLPFTLPVPEWLPAPSVSTADFTLSWVLRAVLDRSMHRDPSTAIELCALPAPELSRP